MAIDRAGSGNFVVVTVTKAPRTGLQFALSLDIQNEKSMKPIIVLLFSSLFIYVMASPLHNKFHAQHHSKRGRTTDTLISQVTKRLTQTASSTASQQKTESIPTPSCDNLTMISRHSITIKTSRSDLPITLPGATTPDDCTQSCPCNGDIMNYGPSVSKSACGNPV